jgi:hypothetical protein
MRRRIYKDLEELERIAAVALQARACGNERSRVEMFRELISRKAIEQRPEESLAGTVARAAGITVRQLKDLLCERAQAVGA